MKRTADGYASNWICDHVRARATRCGCCRRAGSSRPRDLDADLLLFAGGSGITPVMSITRTALADGHRPGRAVLRQPRRALGDLRRRAGRAGRRAPRPAVVVHWLESVQGLPTQEQLRAFAASYFSWRRVRLRPGAVHEGRGGGAARAGVPARPPPPGEVRLAGRQPVRRRGRRADDGPPRGPGDPRPGAATGGGGPARLEVELDGASTPSTTGRRAPGCSTTSRRRASTPRTRAARASARPAPSALARGRGDDAGTTTSSTTTTSPTASGSAASRCRSPTPCGSPTGDRARCSQPSRPRRTALGRELRRARRAGRTPTR